jgi:DtxR family Mn-dependent transcriptional regulator
MATLSAVEENYLKYIFQLSEVSEKGIVKTNDLAYKLEHSAASVTDMLKKLSDKKLVAYKRYYGVSLTKSGLQIAVQVLRKHRLWETFLVKNLKFTWDQVHEIAEQLEHIQSDELIDKMDDYLGHPNLTRMVTQYRIKWEIFPCQMSFASRMRNLKNNIFYRMSMTILLRF